MQVSLSLDAVFREFDLISNVKVRPFFSIFFFNWAKNKIKTDIEKKTFKNGDR